MRIKGWKKIGKYTWLLETPAGRSYRIKLVSNGKSKVFPYTVQVISGRRTFIEEHNEDSLRNAQKRVVRVQKELSRRVMK